jgi:glyoxylase-like metal-dependent hydrolase (beta-lactamase superfamily II)
MHTRRKTIMNPEVHRFKVGTFECMAVSDGTFTYPLHSFFANAPKQALEQVLGEHNIQPGEITTPWICLFINTGRHRVLVDTGGGAGLAPSVGKLLGNLKAEGTKPADIDTVILTHGHPDHIGGNTDAEGKPAFPKARYVMWKDEWEFWTSDPDLAQLQVGEDIKQLMLMLARKNLPPIKGRLDLVDRETEILPGIQAIAAPGHTPGHMALAISSGSEQLLYVSDAALHPVHLEQPGWHAAFDLVPEQTIATRRQLLHRVAAEKVLMIACHFPFPGLGRVIQKRERWQWQPIETRS